MYSTWPCMTTTTPPLTTPTSNGKSEFFFNVFFHNWPLGFFVFYICFLNNGVFRMFSWKCLTFRVFQWSKMNFDMWIFCASCLFSDCLFEFDTKINDLKKIFYI